jgi:hypothetical protein
MTHAKEYERWNSAREVAIEQTGLPATRCAMTAIRVMLETVFELAKKTKIPQGDIMEAVAIVMENYRPKEEEK